MSNYRISADRLTRLLHAMLVEGTSVRQAAKLSGVNRNTASSYNQKLEAGELADHPIVRAILEDVPIVPDLPRRPGVILDEDFMKPRGLSHSDLARAMGVSQGFVSQLIRGESSYQGKSHVTAATAIRLAHVFGNAPEFWLEAQMKFDLWVARKTPRADISKGIFAGKRPLTGAHLWLALGLPWRGSMRRHTKVVAGRLILTKKAG